MECGTAGGFLSIPLLANQVLQFIEESFNVLKIAIH
jgi:hypothetical protein